MRTLLLLCLLPTALCPLPALAGHDHHRQIVQKNVAVVQFEVVYPLHYYTVGAELREAALVERIKRELRLEAGGQLRLEAGGRKAQEGDLPPASSLPPPAFSLPPTVQTYCASCHSADNEGGAAAGIDLYDLPDDELKRLKLIRNLTLHAQHEDEAEQMPPVGSAVRAQLDRSGDRGRLIFELQRLADD